jgi:hypothetical protein
VAHAVSIPPVTVNLARVLDTNQVPRSAQAVARHVVLDGTEMTAFFGGAAVVPGGAPPADEKPPGT